MDEADNSEYAIPFNWRESIIKSSIKSNYNFGGIWERKQIENVEEKKFNLNLNLANKFSTINNEKETTLYEDLKALNFRYFNTLI